jgi:Protein of unknown function (DUF1254)
MQPPQQREPVADLAQRSLHRRAVETVVWTMPIVYFDRMYQAMADAAGGTFNQIVYWSRLPDRKNQTLTPNPDAIYLMPFTDTTDGPVVLEIPPRLKARSTAPSWTAGGCRWRMSARARSTVPQSGSNAALSRPRSGQAWRAGNTPVCEDLQQPGDGGKTWHFLVSS